MKERIARTRRTWVSFGAVVAMLVLFAVPWRTSISAPAVLQAGHKVSVFPPKEARMESVRVQDGQAVAEGDLLFTLKAPDLEQALVLTERRIALIEQRLARRTADDTDLAGTIVLEGQLRQEREAAAGFAQQIEELQVTAPITGRIVFLNESLQPDLWVGRDTLLARMVDDGPAQIRTVLGEQVVERVAVGANATFIADDPQIASIPAVLTSIAPSAQDVLDSPYFSSLYGGEVEVAKDDQGNEETVGSVFSARLSPEAAVSIDREQRGVVRMQGEAESIARGVWRRIAAVLIREATF